MSAISPPRAAAGRQPPPAHSITAREAERSRLAADVEAFLARGGSIERVPRDYRADPPTLGAGRYGRGTI